MAFVETVSEDDARGQVAEVYQEDRDRLGYVANYTRVFAHRPDVFRSWQMLNGGVKAAMMDARRYELATLAAARRLRSSYCMLAHGKVLAERFLEPAAVRELAVDHHAAGLDPIDVAVMDLAEKVAGDATAVTSTDLERLRGFGLSDADIVDIVLAAAARCFFSKTLDALGIEPDAVFAELAPDLRDVLTVGRPIARGGAGDPSLESG
jgi:uncharacterized peroxidase-related enzyme